MQKKTKKNPRESAFGGGISSLGLARVSRQHVNTHSNKCEGEGGETGGKGGSPCVVMSRYGWHRASSAICLLPPLLLLLLYRPPGRSSFPSEPICSAFTVITCLPSSWHVRGGRQPPFTPLSPPPLHAHIPAATPSPHGSGEGSRWHHLRLKNKKEVEQQRRGGPTLTRMIHSFPASDPAVFSCAPQARRC